MFKIVNAWIIRKHIRTALWVYGPEAGLHTPEELNARRGKLARDLEGAARLELINARQYNRLRELITG